MRVNKISVQMQKGRVSSLEATEFSVFGVFTSSACVLRGFKCEG